MMRKRRSAMLLFPENRSPTNQEDGESIGASDREASLG